MEYHCGAGHYIGTPEPVRVDRCPVATCAHPRLRAVGDGSQMENRRLRVLYAGHDADEAASGELDL